MVNLKDKLSSLRSEIKTAFPHPGDSGLVDTLMEQAIAAINDQYRITDIGASVEFNVDIDSNMQKLFLVREIVQGIMHSKLEIKK